MSNPFLERVEKDARSGYAGFHEPSARERATGQTTTQQPHAPQQQTWGQQGGYPQQPQQQYGQPGYGMPQGPGYAPAPTEERGVTLEDVIAKTGTLFAVLLAAAAPAWFLAPSIGGVLWAVGLIGSLGIGFALMFMKKVNIPLIFGYAIFQGIFVGAISSTFSTVFDSAVTGSEAPTLFQGIVVQAVLATLCVFGAMLTLYATGIIKVGQKFRAIVGMMTLGYFVFALVNLGYILIARPEEPFGFGGTGPIGILISLFAVGLASVNLAIDFDNIAVAIKTGAPEKYSWLLGIGLLTTLVWLYLEILRLLGRLRSE